MKTVDISCPNCGGRIKFVEGSNLAVCESCGSQISVEQGIDDMLNRSFDLIQQKRIVSAEEILNQALLLDSKNGQVYLGLLMCELGVATPEDLTKANKDYSNSPNYMRAVQFLDSESKSELVSCCDKNKENLANKTVKATSYPTDKMKEFMSVESITVNGTEMSLFTLMSVSFKRFNDDDEKLSNILLKYGIQFEKAASIYQSLSENEIMHLPFFDSDNANKVIEAYVKIKSRIHDFEEQNDDENDENEDDDDYESEENFDSGETVTVETVTHHSNNVVGANFAGAHITVDSGFENRGKVIVNGVDVTPNSTSKKGFVGIDASVSTSGNGSKNTVVGINANTNRYSSDDFEEDEEEFEYDGLTYYEYEENDERSQKISELKEKIRNLLNQLKDLDKSYNQQISQYNISREFKKADKLSKELSTKQDEIIDKLNNFCHLIDKQRIILNCQIEKEEVQSEYDEYINSVSCTTFSEKRERKHQIKSYEEDLKRIEKDLLKLNNEYEKMERKIK